MVSRPPPRPSQIWTTKALLEFIQQPRIWGSSILALVSILFIVEWTNKTQDFLAPNQSSGEVVNQEAKKQLGNAESLSQASEIDNLDVLLKQISPEGTDQPNSGTSGDQGQALSGGTSPNRSPLILGVPSVNQADLPTLPSLPNGQNSPSGVEAAGGSGLDGEVSTTLTLPRSTQASDSQNDRPPESTSANRTRSLQLTPETLFSAPRSIGLPSTSSPTTPQAPNPLGSGSSNLPTGSSPSLPIPAPVNLTGASSGQALANPYGQRYPYHNLGTPTGGQAATGAYPYNYALPSNPSTSVGVGSSLPSSPTTIPTNTSVQNSLGGAANPEPYPYNPGLTLPGSP